MELASKLRELLGNEIVADDPETVAAHSGDKWFAAHEPDAVVFARSTGDVSKLLEFASREKFRSQREAVDSVMWADACRHALELPCRWCR